MQADYHRYDVTDEKWAAIKPHLPGQHGQWGGVAADNRRFFNAVCWVFRTGAPWRRLPPEYGKWKTAHERFRRWRRNGVWEKLLEILVDDPDFEWLIIDAAQPKYIWPWMRMVCRSEYLSHRMPELIASKLLS